MRGKPRCAALQLMYYSVLKSVLASALLLPMLAFAQAGFSPPGDAAVTDTEQAPSGTSEDISENSSAVMPADSIADVANAGPEAANNIAIVPDKEQQMSKADQKSMQEEISLVQTDVQQRQVRALCGEIGNKLGSVSVEDCLTQPLAFGGAYTVQSRPIVVRDFFRENDAEGDKEKPTRILILGGIHGDEYSSISIMFKWMEMLVQSENRDFRWRFAPTVNPDGLLDSQAVRQNANGVDLNRNFPSSDWQDLAEEYWYNTTNRNPRRFPGSHPASEPEVQWVVDQIKSFKPDVIVSVHAPYHLLDYDGPPEAPQQIGELHLHLLGVYPGSLGNYAGNNLGIPVITMELPSAGIMPNNEQIVSMWNDLLKWLYEHHEF